MHDPVAADDELLTRISSMPLGEASSELDQFLIIWRDISLATYRKKNPPCPTRPPNPPAPVRRLLYRFDARGTR